MPKLPKISAGMPKISAPKMSMPKISMPKTPVAPSLKSVNTGNLTGGPTAGQKASASLFKSVQAPKMAVVKGAVRSAIPKLKF